MKESISIAALIACLVPLPGLAAAVYRITELGTLGGAESFAGSISDSRRVVGRARLPGDQDIHTFLYRKGELKDLFPLNSQEIVSGAFPAINNAGQIASGVVIDGVYLPAIYDSKSGAITILGTLSQEPMPGFNGVALGINDSGRAVGYSYLDDGNRHAFLWQKGTMVDIGSLGGYSVAQAINNDGVIVGFSSYDPVGFAHAFIYAQGVMTDINPFGGLESYAMDVNSWGQVIGTGLTREGDAFHGFLNSHGIVKDLGVLPGGRNSTPLALNNRGQVVGSADAPVGVVIIENPETGSQHEVVVYGPKAFLYEQGEMVDLNSRITPPSSWDLQYASDINNSGQILGYGYLAGQYRAFLLTVHAR